MNGNSGQGPGTRNLLARIASSSAKHPFWVLGVSLLFSIASILFTLRGLEFKTGRNDLVADKEPAVNRYREISENFGRMTHAIVVVEGGDPEEMKRFIDTLAERLKTRADLFGNIFFRVDTSSLEGKKLLYLTRDELSDLNKKLIDYGELIEELTFTPQLSRILAFVNQKISEATVSHIISGLIGGGRESTREGEKGAPKDPPADPPDDPIDLGFIRSLLVEMRAALNPSYRFQSPWNAFFGTKDEFAEEGYFFSDDQRFAFMVLDLKKKTGSFTARKEALEVLRMEISRVLSNYPGLEAGVTGETALATDEMVQAFRDTTWASIISLAGIGLLVVSISRQVFNPVMILISLVAAICWTFGWLTLTIGHLTILSVAFTPILLGLGVDFGIHLIARYREEKASGLSPLEAIENCCRYTGKAIAAGALTTAFAFFAIMLADFRGIQELGFIAGSGVLFALLSTFTILPSLLMLAERRSAAAALPAIKRSFRPLEFFYRNRGRTLLAAALLSAAALAGAKSVKFDYNLLNLQAEGTESVVWERKIIAHSSRSSWYALSTAESLQEARRMEKRFESLPSVRKVDSLASLIPENQEERIRHVRALRPIVARFELEMDRPEPVQPDELSEWLEKIKFKLRTDVRWDPQKKPDETEILSTRQALLALEEELKALPPETVRNRLEPFQTRLFEDFSEKFELLKNNSNPAGPIEEKDIPAKLKENFRGENGRYLLRVYSEKNIWEKEPMTEFVTQLKTVDPQITGSPVVGYIAIDLMRKGYLHGSTYAFIAVFIVVWITLRRFKWTGLALVPLSITVLWTLGWMGLSGTPFNLANVIALPLILGIVVDYGIHIVHRFQENPDAVEGLVTGSTAQAVTLTSWTTMIGFGSLLISKHYGIFSLGLVVTSAVTTAWLLSLILLPVILSYYRKSGH
jgi:hopanoid biosynthesis associated RND transporter like protein HpnN